MAGRSRGVVIEISAEENTQRAFAAVDAQVAQLRAQVQSLKSQLAGTGESLAQGFSHAVPEIAAASGAVRELEGNLPIRAVERFLTTTLGLGPVLAAAFPVVGAVAFIGVITDAIGKLDDMYQKAKEAPEVIKRATDEMTLRLKLSNDELDRTNANLQEEIDKLEGKPTNKLQEELAGSRIEAERLALALGDDLKKLDELLSQNHVGFLGGLLTGRTSTGDIEKDIQGQNQGLRDVQEAAARKLSDALGAANGDQKKIVDAKKAYYDQLDKDFGDYIRRYQNRITELTKQQQREQAAFDAAQNTGAPFVGVGSATSPHDRSAEIAQAQSAVANAIELQNKVRRTAQTDTLTVKKDQLRPAGASDNSVAEARKALNDALRRQAEEFAQAELAFAKQQSDLQIAELDDKHKRMEVSDLDYYEQRKKIQETALDAESESIRKKQEAIAAEIEKVYADAARPKISQADVIRDSAKVVELQTQAVALDEQRKRVTEERAKIDIDAALQVYELSVKRTQLVDELAAKREAITGGVEDRLHQSSDNYDIKRQGLVANFGENSKEVSDADFAFANEQGHIRAKGAEETSNVAVADIDARRKNIDDAVTTQDAQRLRISLDNEEAKALKPVLEAYQELANTGDLQATQKVIELRSRIDELETPVDEVAKHMRESFDGAFESLFENLDQGLKGFENFTRSVQKTLEQAAYKKFLEPLVQEGLAKLIPNRTGAPGVGYGDAGVGGVNPIPVNPGTDIGGGAVKAAASIGSALGIPGLSGLDKKGGAGTITIVLENESGLPLKLGDIKPGGNVDRASVEAIIKDSFEDGGLMRTLLAGFHV